MVLEKMELLMEMVGLKMLIGGTPGLFSIMAWLPETMKRGKTTEKTQPAMTWDSGMLVITARGRPNPRK